MFALSSQNYTENEKQTEERKSIHFFFVMQVVACGAVAFFFIYLLNKKYWNNIGLQTICQLHQLREI